MNTMAWYIRKYIRRLIYSEGVTPLPATILTLLFLVMFFNGMASTMAFSYLPQMVKSFGISEVETGYYAGLIGSAVYVGWIFCSLLWGYIGDTYGLKLGLLITTGGVTVTTLSFGFSTNFYWALFTRLIQGMFMGNIVIAKSILAKALDSTNMSLGFAIFCTCWTIAFITGPTMAGFLVFPAEQYPASFSKDSLFGRFGVLLPNFIVASCLLVTIILVIIFLPNDRKTKNQTSEKVCLLEASNSKEYTEETELGCFNVNEYYVLSIEENQDGPPHYSKDNEQNTVTADNSVKNHSLLAKLSCIIPEGALKVLKMLRSKDFVVCLCLFALIGFCVVGVEEIFPVYAATSREYNGLGLSTSQIGTILLGSSIFLLVIQLTITSKVTHRFGPRKTLVGCTLLLVFTAPLIPTISAIENKTGQIAFSISIMMLNQVLINGTIITINVLINNSVTAGVYGSANGIALTATSLGRVLSPTIYGSIYSWSLTNVKGVAGNTNPLGFPFDQYLTFLVAGISFLMCSVIAIHGISSNLDVPLINDTREQDIQGRQ